MRVGVEGVRDDRLALRLGGRRPRRSSPPATRSRATRRRTSARSRRRPSRPALSGPQECVDRDARRVPRAAAISCCAWLAAEPRIRCVEAGRARSTCSPTSSEFLSPDGIRTSAELAQALLDEARVGGDAGRGVRRARVPADLVRDVARSTEATACDALDRDSRAGIDVRSMFLTPAPTSRRRRARTLCLPPDVHRSTPCSTPSRAIVGAEHVRTDAESRADLRHRRAEARPRRRRRRAARQRRRRSPRSCGSARRTACRSCRAAPAPATPAARCRLHGGVVALARADEPHPRDRRGEPRRRRRAERHHRRSAGRGRDASACSIRPIPRRCGSRSIGGNVAECAGGPRAFKYGTTKQYVLGLEAVLPTGEIIETGGKVVKNVVGYDLTHLLVGSEGTLAIITQDHPAPGAEAAGAVDAARDVPSIVDAAARGHQRHPGARRAGGGRADRRRFARSGRAVSRRPVAGAGGHRARCCCSKWTALAAAVERGGRARSSRRAARPARPRSCARATRPSAQEIWRVRRELSLALKMITPIKFNHDVVVPKGRIPELFDARRAAQARLPPAHPAASATPATATSTSTSWSTPGDADEIARAHAGRARAVRRGRRARRLDQRRARHRVRQGAVPAARAVADEIALMKRVKRGVRSARHPESGQDLSGPRSSAPPSRRHHTSRRRFEPSAENVMLPLMLNHRHLALVPFLFMFLARSQSSAQIPRDAESLRQGDSTRSRRSRRRCRRAWTRSGSS